jgi:hypothetical protein
MQTQNSRAEILRRGIKATVVQLDRWESDQLAQDKRREKANSRFPHGVKDRRVLARHLAVGSSESGAPYCDFCDASGHLSYECQVTQDIPDLLKTVSEKPSTGIHRAIVHRLYLQACELYRSSYPLFYPGAVEESSVGQDQVPVDPCIYPDYFSLAVGQAVEDFRACPGIEPSDIRRQHSASLTIARLYYSKSFAVNFSEFCDLIADQLAGTPS